MPKQTFFNLSKEKQNLLVCSAKKEFSRVPLSEASIANIIKDADIARGSFYQYFEDKEDAFYYILEEYMKKHRHEFMEVLRRNNGDLFDGFIEFFKYMLVEFQDQENIGFFRNLFLNLNYKMENKLMHGFNKSHLEEQFLILVAEINVNQLNASSKKEIEHTLKIIAAVTNHNLMQNFAKNISIEEAIKNYQLEIELLKKGLSKNIES